MNPIVYPLLALLGLLLVLRTLGDEMKPITAAMIQSLSKQAGRHAGVILTACAFGLAASLAAFYDMFKDLDAKSATALSYWQLAACWAKVFHPFIVTALAYVLRPSISGTGKEPSPGLSNAPFPPKDGAAT